MSKLRHGFLNILWNSQSLQLPSSFCAPSVLQLPQNLEESVEVLRVEAGSLGAIF